mmetsp:Transcript_16822/g.38856  ORF Transcript_16822/g.38856 Transcript_16822/m.38856 type:complete len:105 (+) Transcript_16822:100-414(+)
MNLCIGDQPIPLSSSPKPTVRDLCTNQFSYEVKNIGYRPDKKSHTKCDNAHFISSNATKIDRCSPLLLVHTSSIPIFSFVRNGSSVSTPPVEKLPSSNIEDIAS